MNVHTKVPSYTVYFFSKRFTLGTGMNRLCSLWNSGVASSRGRCSPIWHQAASGSHWLCVIGGKTHVYQARRFALFDLHPHPLSYLYGTYLLSFSHFPDTDIGQIN